MRREYKNFDLIVPLGGNLYWAIENKFKSLPDPSQLEDYEKELTVRPGELGRNPDIRYTLLAPQKPDFFRGDSFGRWSFLSYQSIVEAIRSTLANSDREFEIQLIIRYANLIDDLLRLRDVATFSSNDDFIDQNLYDKLKPLRLHDFVYKWKVEDLAQSFRQACRDRYEWSVSDRNIFDSQQEDSTCLHIYTGFTRGLALLDVYKNGGSKEKKFTVGLQVQHDVLRLSVVGLEEHDDLVKSTLKMAEELLESKSSEGVWRESGRKTSSPNRFGPTHFYVHRRITKISRESLLNLIESLSCEYLMCSDAT